MGDQEWQNFVAAFEERAELLQRKAGEEKEKGSKKKREKERNVWIVKPGENSNQGNGIQVFETLEEIREMVKNSGRLPNGRQHSYIVQRYLMPFLYNRRKFDIRCYVLVTCIKGIYKAYWYEEGYIRTSSK
jgi:tubulin monoglycylase TTLL3/8